MDAVSSERINDCVFFSQIDCFLFVAFFLASLRCFPQMSGNIGLCAQTLTGELTELAGNSERLGRAADCDRHRRAALLRPL